MENFRLFPQHESMHKDIHIHALDSSAVHMFSCAPSPSLSHTHTQTHTHRHTHTHTHTHTHIPVHPCIFVFCIYTYTLNDQSPGVFLSYSHPLSASLCNLYI